MITPFEETCLSQAIELADLNARRGYFPYAALLVCGEQILAEASNTVKIPEGVQDLPIFETPIAHPETALVIHAFNLVQERFPEDPRAQREMLLSLSIISNIEPCPMCARAMAGALIQRVVFAVDGETALRASGVEGTLPQSNQETFLKEYGLHLSSEGPHLRDVALKSFVSVWNRVQALERLASTDNG